MRNIWSLPRVHSLVGSYKGLGRRSGPGSQSTGVSATGMRVDAIVPGCVQTKRMEPGGMPTFRKTETIGGQERKSEYSEGQGSRHRSQRSCFQEGKCSNSKILWGGPLNRHGGIAGIPTSAGLSRGGISREEGGSSLPGSRSRGKASWRRREGRNSSCVKEVMTKVSNLRKCSSLRGKGRGVFATNQINCKHQGFSPAWTPVRPTPKILQVVFQTIAIKQISKSSHQKKEFPSCLSSNEPDQYP